MDSVYAPIWINTNIILCAWKPRTSSELETMTIPQKHIEFAKGNFTHIVVANDVVENENEQ
jgi:hypothetical protein